MTETRAQGDLIGYARVSTSGQDEGLQIDALERAGCTRIFIDRASGTRRDRPELVATLDYLRPGDTLCVWRLDRLGRSLPHLITVIESLRQQQVQFRSLREAIDTNTPGGLLFFHLTGAFAQFERDLISERTREGLEAARARGSRPGRKPALSPQQVKVVRDLAAARDLTIREIASTVGVSRATVYRALEGARVSEKGRFIAG